MTPKVHLIGPWIAEASPGIGIPRDHYICFIYKLETCSQGIYIKRYTIFSLETLALISRRSFVCSWRRRAMPSVVRYGWIRAAVQGKII